MCPNSLHTHTHIMCVFRNTFSYTFRNYKSGKDYEKCVLLPQEHHLPSRLTENTHFQSAPLGDT